MKYKSKTNSSLGRSLIKNQRKVKPTNDSERHTTDDQPNTKSITDNTTLEEFLSTAELTNKQFTAEREKITILDNETATTIPTTTWTVEELEKELLIPRRPHWDSNTTAEELKQLENENYLKWRRKLADLQERSDVVLTPFEKNLEFWRQLWRVVERSDILVQILDARNPLMFHCEDLDRYIKEVDKNKLNVILLNKADYLTESQRQDWFNYFTSIGKTCIFFSALEQQPSADKVEDDAETVQNKLIDLQIQPNDLSMPLSYIELISYFKSLKSKLRLSESKSSITVGLIGYPNVGKSSTINALLRSKRVSVSTMPGKTKHFQTIILDEEVTICDCPGLVFPNIVSSKAEMIINGILPIDQMKDAIPPIGVIVSKIPAHVFESLYGILLMKSNDSQEHDDLDRKVTALELLSTYGYSRGFMTQRGLPDTSRAARYILKDFVTGKLLFCYAPPIIDQEKYHFYPKKEESGSMEVRDKKLARIYEANNIVRKNFDKEFFGKQMSGVHTKGSRGMPNHSRQYSQMGSVSSMSSGDKPWKKHNNRNKKEKLRKVYAHLDE